MMAAMKAAPVNRHERRKAAALAKRDRSRELAKRHAREVKVAEPFHADKAATEVARAPTPGQSEAGNYKKGHIKIYGLSIAIETPCGGVRRKVDEDGKEHWRVVMPAHYGYVKGTKGADGDHVDVYVGPHPHSPRVFVIDQVNAETGAFDEHKCMLGFWHKGDAINCYDAGFSDGKGPQRRKNVTEMSVAAFKRWIETGDTKTALVKLALPERSTPTCSAISALSAMRRRPVTMLVVPAIRHVPRRHRSAARRAEPLGKAREIRRREIRKADGWDDALRKAEPLAQRIAAAMQRLSGIMAQNPQQSSPDDRIKINIEDAMGGLDTSFDDGAYGTAKKIQIDFDKRPSSTSDVLARMKVDLARELTDEQRAMVAKIVRDDAARGAPPAEMARRIRESVGLTENQAQHVANFRRELEAGSAAALKRALRDKRYDRTVQRAVDSGEPLAADQIDAMVAAYKRRYVDLRANTIARTESLRAANLGSLEAMQAAIDRGEIEPGDVVKRWIATGDGKTRPSHQHLHGQEVRGLETPFVTTSGVRLRYPHDPDAPAAETIRCRCTMAFDVRPRS